MLKNQLIESLKQVIADLGYKIDDIVLSIPKNPNFGDYSTNIPLQLSKQKFKNRNQSTLEIANSIIQKLQALEFVQQNIKEIQVAGGGFINFFFHPEVFKKVLSQIDQNFGLSEVGDKHKVILEHTSVNPNKAMHIGHLRNAIIGDTLNRILTKQGFMVETQNYIDDTGVQVADTYVGMSHLAELNFREKGQKESQDDYFWDLYAAVNHRYEEDPEFLKHRVQVQSELEDHQSKTAQEVKELALNVVKAMQSTISDFGISHNLLVWESDILELGFWEAAFKILQNTAGFEKETTGKNAGTWLVRFGEGEDGDHNADKIFVRSNGITTYTAKDFAYHLWKFGLLGKDFFYKKWLDNQNPDGSDIYSTNSQASDPGLDGNFGHGDLVDTVIDERQSYLQQVIREIFARLGYQNQAENLKHISYGVVTLSASTAKSMGIIMEDNKKSYTMSGRKGIGVKVKDLLNLMITKIQQEKQGKLDKRGGNLDPKTIAVGAIKYFMLKFNSTTEIAFDLDQALSIYGATGPYLQYTHARAFGILEKMTGYDAEDMSYDLNKEEVRLIRKLLDWPDVLSEAGLVLEPSLVATYAFELAQVFNTFYEKNQVANAASAAEKSFRFQLVQKFQMVFKQVLDTLGIEAPERM